LHTVDLLEHNGPEFVSKALLSCEVDTRRPLVWVGLGGSKSRVSQAFHEAQNRATRGVALLPRVTLALRNRSALSHLEQFDPLIDFRDRPAKVGKKVFVQESPISCHFTV
jgi:hypothetical protein